MVGRRKHHRVVRFAAAPQYIVELELHEGYNTENVRVARHELWYTKTEYHQMKLDVKEDVLKVRSKAAAGSPFNYSGNDGASANESSGCCIGIEHLLTPVSFLEVERCRARNDYAVLAAQARSKDLPTSDSEIDIALASIAQTAKVELRARSIGKLHQDSI